MFKHSPLTTVIRRHWWVLSVVPALVVAAGLRFWNLDHLPPSLYWEEVALGYDAYSLAETARDHHGHFLPWVALESFGDYKPALYAYAVVPFIKLVGLNAWAVRLPSAVAGLVSVGLVGGLAWMLAPSKKRRAASAVAVWVAAISPWGVMFSRAGWEVNLATMLVLAGMVSGVWAVEFARPSRRLAWMLLATLSLILSTYTYHATRMLSPVLGLGLAIEWWRAGVQWKAWRSWLAVAGLALVLSWPLLQSVGSPVVGQRWAETSLWADGQHVVESNARRATDASRLGYLLSHRYLIGGRQLVASYLNHFRPDFLFVSGDANARHSTQFSGQLYYLEVAWLLLGLGGLVASRTRNKWLLAVWLGWGIVPAAITVGSPHALRILPTWPVWMILITFGLLQGWVIFKQVWQSWLQRSPRSRTPMVVSWGILVVGSYLLQFGLFWRYYTLVYPVVNAQDWQYGYQEMVAAVVQAQASYPELPVTVSRELGRPAMYYWFYTQADPRQVQAANSTSQKDQGEFLTYENLTFVRGVGELQPGIVAAPPAAIGELVASNPGRVHELAVINDLRGQPVWLVVRYE